MRTSRTIPALLALALAPLFLTPAPALAAPPGKGPAAKAGQTGKPSRSDPKSVALAEASALSRDAQIALEKKKYDEALPLALKALAIREKLEPEGVWTGVSLRQIAEIYTGKKDFARAVPYLEKKLALTEKHPQNDADILFRTEELGRGYQNAGDHAKAMATFDRALIVAKRIDRGKEREHSVSSLSGLAHSLKLLKRYDEAEAMLVRGVKAREQDDYMHALSSSLFALGTFYHEMGRFTRAAETLERAFKEMLGSRELAGSKLFLLALTYISLEDWSRAEALCDELIAYARTSGDEHFGFVGAVTLRGNFEMERGAYDRAEQLYQRAQQVLDKLRRDPEEADAVASYEAMLQSEFGRLALEKGDYARADALLSKSLAHYEKTEGPRSRAVAESAESLAELYFKAQRYDKAEAFASRAFSIREEVMPPVHPARATTRSILGKIHEARGDATGAKKLHEEGLVMREKAFGNEHPFVARSLLDLADLARRQKDAVTAENYYKRAIAIFEKTFGPEYDSVATALEGLAALYVQQGKVDLAIRAIGRAAEIRERQAALIIAGGSETQKRLFISTLRAGTDFITSVHARVAPNDERAKKIALTTIFQRKGRVLDVMAGSLSALRQRLNKEEAQIFEELTIARSGIAALAMRGPKDMPLEDFKRMLLEREEKVRALEERLGSKSDVFRAEETPVTIERVQALIPEDMALVEIALYTPRTSADRDMPSREAPPRFAAYVLDNSGKISFVDLGESTPIEEATKVLREKLADPDTADPKAPARALDALVMQKIRPLLPPKKTRLLISADGALSLVPFAALVDEDGHFLVEKYEITYLTSGRDLIRLSRATQPGEGALVVANPAFGKAETSGSALDLLADNGNAGQTRGLDKAYFEPLPATAGEARALAKVLPGASIRVDLDASEVALKKARAPKILHVATHGFFLSARSNSKTAAAPGERGQGERGLELDFEEPQDWLPDDPLLRSGIALAGANAKKGGEGEDGILTALEASSLDLNGTELVVLSACETGLGDIFRGEGVYGLRRALFVAGAETLVVSLWKVADEETKNLMVGYYGEVMRGKARSTALRDVQLGMLSGKEASHPYFWASFGVFGDPTPMGSSVSGKGGAAPKASSSKPLGAVAPSARGCACGVAGETNDDAGIFPVLAVLSGVVLRRRRSRARS